MMTIADLMKICLEFDQQQITSRPSPWGIVAERLAIVCEHAEASLRDDKILGDWRAVDLSHVADWRVSDFDQPTMSLVEEVERLQGIITLASRAIHETIHRHMGVAPDSVYEFMKSIDAPSIGSLDV